MNKKVLITGCSSGIGKALAEEYLRQGAFVYLAARDISKLDSFNNINSKKIKLDVLNDEDIDSAVEYVSENGLDILINNAGYGLISPLADIPDEEFELQIRTNVFALLKLTKKIIPVFIKQGSGTIINIGSISGIAATPFSGAYSASKAAVNSISDSLRMELKPFGIKVISVQPGGIKSNFGEASARRAEKIIDENSIFYNYKEKILIRARASQRIAAPADKFARKLTAVSLRKNPPAIFRMGTNSRLLPLLKRTLPEKLLDKLFAKIFGLK